MENLPGFTEAKISAYSVYMYNGSLDTMSKPGHFPFQIFFMQKKKKKV